MNDDDDIFAPFFENVIQIFAPLVEGIGAVAKAGLDSFYQVYLEQGAPYGETQEGFSRWLDELKGALVSTRSKYR